MIINAIDENWALFWFFNQSSGHLIIANFVLQNSDLDQVWFIVSPQNPLKPSAGLLNEYHRLFLLNIAIEGENKLKHPISNLNYPSHPI